MSEAEQVNGWHCVTFHVRYAETDQMGFVHHSNYIVWMEEGRSAALRALGLSYAQFEAEGFYLAVSEVHVRYIAPARYDRAVTVRVRASQVRSRAITFDYEIVDTQTDLLLVTAQTDLVCMDQNGNATRLPPAWRHVLTRTCCAGPSAGSGFPDSRPGWNARPKQDAGCR